MPRPWTYTPAPPPQKLTNKQNTTHVHILTRHPPEQRVHHRKSSASGPLMAVRPFQPDLRKGFTTERSPLAGRLSRYAHSSQTFAEGSPQNVLRQRAVDRGTPIPVRPSQRVHHRTFSASGPLIAVRPFQSDLRKGFTTERSPPAGR